MRLPSALRWGLAAALIGIALLVLKVFWHGDDVVAMRGLRALLIRGRIYGPSESGVVRSLAPIWSGEVRRAKTLEGITSSGNATAAAWSDYSAALYGEAVPDDAFQLAKGLAATDHALELDPNLPQALFNRALTLDAMSLRAAAVDAYKRYLKVDESSQWKLVVRSRLEKLDTASRAWEKAEKLERLATSDDELAINDWAIASPQEARQWVEMHGLATWAERFLAKDAAGAASMLRRCRIVGRALETQLADSFVADTVRAIDRAADPTDLARAHVSYEHRIMAYWQSPMKAPDVDLNEAERLFEANGSPMVLAIRRLKIFSNPARTASLLLELFHQTPERYRALRAQLQWLDASVESRSGRRDTALKLYRSASATFTALGDKTNAAMTRELEATLLANAGRTDEAWQLRHATLLWATEVDDEFPVAVTLYGAARDACAIGRWDIAHALLNASVELPERREEALAWRAFTAQRAGMNRTAAAELQTARQAERRWGDLDLVEALLARTPAEGLARLSEPLKAAEQLGNKGAIAQLLVERARLLRATGQAARAHEDLERAVALLGRIPAGFSSVTIRDAVLGTPDKAYRLLADSLDARGETERALDTLELSPGSKPRGSLSPHTLLITYGVFDDRLSIYTRSSLGLIRTGTTVSRSRIENLVSQFDQAIANNDQRAFQRISRTLEHTLVEPIATQIAAADTLVFVRDPVFRNLPFAALSSGNNHYLIHDHNVVVTPSFSAFLRASHTKTTISRALLSVGNPLSDERPGGALASLPAAESEAEEIAAMYPSHSLLVEGDATKDRVVGALPYCDAAHFAVHANVGLGDLMPPHLILTKTANDEGILTAPQIAALHLNGLRTVMLAGCRTALSSQPGGDSLVDAFLTAGAGSVVGTLWEVEDASTRTMSTMFHRELRKGLTPKEALRATQLEMIKRGEAPSVWASLQLYGSGQ